MAIKGPQYAVEAARPEMGGGNGPAGSGHCGRPFSPQRTNLGSIGRSGQAAPARYFFFPEKFLSTMAIRIRMNPITRNR